MPNEDRTVTPEEWERLTGERGSVYIGRAPAKRTKNQDVRDRGVFRCALCDKNWNDPRATG